MEDLKGKMDLYIKYRIIYDEKLSSYFDRVIKDEDKLKEFFNELLEQERKGWKVEIVELYNNLGY